MTLLETSHAEHKARLARLGGIPPKSPNLSALEQEQHRRRLIDLQAKIDRQKDIIADLNSVVAKQRSIIRKFSGEEDVPTPRIADIIAVVADHFKFSKIVLIGPGRCASIAYARQIGYHLCREYGYAFLPIGRAFCKDHSSAVHGASKIAKQLPGNRRLEVEIENIKTAIESYVARRIETVKAMMA